jgi:hypothetical protein
MGVDTRSSACSPPFDAPFDVATSELALELAYPADTDTAEMLRQLAQIRRPRR